MSHANKIHVGSVSRPPTRIKVIISCKYWKIHLKRENQHRESSEQRPKYSLNMLNLITPTIQLIFKTWKIKI